MIYTLSDVPFCTLRKDNQDWSVDLHEYEPALQSFLSYPENYYEDMFH
jgi:hypothetical protein